MASLTRYSKSYKIRYRIYYADGADRVVFAYRTERQEAVRLKGQAESLESITRQNARPRDRHSVRAPPPAQRGRSAALVAPAGGPPAV
jgi:hypothetical protein